MMVFEINATSIHMSIGKNLLKANYIYIIEDGPHVERDENKLMQWKYHNGKPL